MPLIQDFAWLSLEPMQIEIPLRGALSMENIRVNVPSVFTVAIGTTPGTDAERGHPPAGHAPHGDRQTRGRHHLRPVAAGHRLDADRGHQPRPREVPGGHQNSLEPELRKIGLVLINVNITDITDESGYIEAIGQKAASQAIQKARGDVADNEKMGEIRVADAEREKAVQVANAHKLREIGTREATREQAVRVAELDKEQQVGEQSAAFQKQSPGQGRRARDAHQAGRCRRPGGRGREPGQGRRGRLAGQPCRSRRPRPTRWAKPARCRPRPPCLEAEHLARAKAALAEAQRIEAERRAALEAPAKADKAKIEVEAAAEAAKRRIEAEGEASAIFAKLEAEARGQFEILSKKGQGLQQIIEACGGAQQAFQLLMLEHFDHLVEASAKAISNIKFDKVVVWEGNPANGQSATANWLHNMSRTLPPMMQVMRDIGGVEIPETLATLAAAEKKPDLDGAARPRPTVELTGGPSHRIAAAWSPLA